MKGSRLFLLVFLLGLISCGASVLGKDGLEEYLADPNSGLKKGRVVGDLQIEIAYRPTELVWFNDLKKLDKGKQDSLLQQYRNRFYFVAHYSSPQKANMDPLSSLASNKVLYNELLANLSFDFHNRVTIKLLNGELIHAVGSSFSKSYGISPINSVLFYLEDERLNKEKEVRMKIEDIGFGIGQQQFSFQQEDIEQTPVLKL